MSDPVSLLGTAYRDLSAVLSSLSVPEGFEPTGCAGWTAVDLGFHLLSDARRALVALNTPVAVPADTTAVVVAAGRVEATDVVATQGHALTVADLLSTLTVEAAVHHLDLVLRLDRPGPAAAPLAEVRRVLEGLLGRPLPAGWDDVTAARRGTGREPLSASDHDELGAAAAAFPLFG
jgi:hypothetical protein